jgi:hypothetical protein
LFAKGFMIAIAAPVFFLATLFTPIATHDCYAADQRKQRPAGALYRYRDKDGGTHIGQTIPPQNVKYGYEVIDRYGQVIETVERALSEQGRKALESSKQEAQRLAVSKREQAEKDALLLKTFSSAADAERARDRKLAALDVIIDITKGNILRLQVEYENKEKEAAGYERVGKEPPAEILEELEKIQVQIDTAFQFVKSKEDEKKSVTQEYEGDILRLRELNDSDGQASSVE